MLPGVYFKIENGALGGQDISEDGVAGLMMSGIEGAVGVAPTWVVQFIGFPTSSDTTLTIRFPDGNLLPLTFLLGTTEIEAISQVSTLFQTIEGWSFDDTNNTVSGPLSLSETVTNFEFQFSTLIGSTVGIHTQTFDAGVAQGIEFEKVYTFTSLSQAVDLGITATSPNAFAYGHISDFYKEAVEGSELNIFLLDGTVLMSEMLDLNNGNLANFMSQTKGRVRKLGVSRDASNTYVDGDFLLDEDVDQAVLNGEVSRKYYVTKMMPFRLIVDGKNFNINSHSGELKDYRQETSAGVSVFVSSSKKSSNASVGLMLGAFAQQPVQRKISRVKNGKLAITTAFMTSQEDVEDDSFLWDELHNKGYVFIRTYPNKSGYYFSSDTTCTSLTDDYSSLSRGAVIDKAMLIAYDVFSNEIDDEIDTDENGNLDAGEIKDLQSIIEETLKAKMVNNQECTSVLCSIDPAQDTMSSGQLAIVLRVKPRGYKTYINVSLGFTL